MYLKEVYLEIISMDHDSLMRSDLNHFIEEIILIIYSLFSKVFESKSLKPLGSFGLTFIS